MNTLFNSATYLACFQGTLKGFLHYILITSLWHSLVFNLFLLVVPSMLKATLKNFQWPSSLFHLMFSVSIKQLQICKWTSKFVYSRKKIYTTMYLKLAKRAECSSGWCKMLYRDLKLYIIIEISKQSSEKCVQQAQALCNSIFSLFLSRTLVVVFSSLSKEMYFHGQSDVKFYIATFQKKNMTCKTSFLNHESLCHTQKFSNY